MHPRMKLNLQIQHYMTPMPFSIGRDVSIQDAQSFMVEHQIRHLPVLDHGKLLGIVTERDLKLASTLTDSKIKWTCGDVVYPYPFIVEPEEPFQEVLKEMIERKQNFALIQHPAVTS